MTFRKLAVLIVNLPRTSRLAAIRAGDLDGQRWGDTEHLLAIVADRLAALQVTVAYKDTGKKPPSNAVRPIPRPKLQRPGSYPDGGMAMEILEGMGKGQLPDGVQFLPVDTG